MASFSTTILPSFPVLAAYTVASLALFITPGPDMSLFLAKTLSGGRRAGLAAMLGAMAGCCVHTLLAALGISALIAASAPAFLALKIVGALYLLWLAVQAIRQGSALNLAGSSAPAEPIRRVFMLGVLVNLTNPKIVLFFVTFLPQFVEAADPHASAKLAFLGLYFVMLATPLAALMVWSAEGLIHTLRRHPRVVKIVDYGFAGIFGLFAIRILATSGK